MISIRENYQNNVIPYFTKELGYKNRHAIPRLLKATINTGIGSSLKQESNAKELMGIFDQDMAAMSGQKPVHTKAKTSVAGFGTRKGQVLGLKVTLRGKRMFDFLERFVNLVLPRIRDFAGIPLQSIDEHGNLTVGIKEHTVFPEIGTGKQAQKVKKIFGLQVTLTSNAKSKQEGITLYQTLGFPLEHKEE